VNQQTSGAEIFDVFLCHNSEDKSAVREIAEKLSLENVKPWLDETDIKPGSFWATDIQQQFSTVKSAAVFVGQNGVGPWQHREIIALLDQFDKRGCPVVPVILPSAPANLTLPWSLLSLHCVDFRAPNSHPLKRLIWGITGEKSVELSDVSISERPITTQTAVLRNLLPTTEKSVAKAEGRFDDAKAREQRLFPALTEAPDGKQVARLKILRERVMEYWVDGVLKHSLHDEVLISLGKRAMDEAIDMPWKYPAESFDRTNSASTKDRDVSSIYDSAGLLLILGEPGSGKTTTLL